ncbi:glutathione S-transferase C-terminal domain-containing protein [Paenibacillus sp. GCM10012307]|uniref:Glutathione S-transferase C-terminal domain-containing protein n=1 Tax=Paenibacillus roseus TaxID=2798579 RepID=A0A934MS21_9BACL|nr:glutathione S-transferase C-terminal domain-containing protein [Paenibacillus roseus]MBJ6362874.1 glutathione S-transferase C-terminal domain-containing protein [Paenibacillus roseus]
MTTENLQSNANPRPKEIEHELDEKGYFNRQKNRFTTPFGDGESKLPIEAGRYRLIWSKGCHWSNRTSIVRELLGLEEAISVNLVKHGEHGQDVGWEFLYDENGTDPVLGVQFLRELYTNAEQNYEGRATVPAVVDITTKKVVNNDYVWLTNYLENEFAPFHKPGAPDLYPIHLREAIDKYNDFLFHNVNNGVYKAMFARSIEAYNDAYNQLFSALDTIEETLDTNRFLFGDYVTDSDVRLFVTLARFDTDYFKYLGPLRNRIVDFKNIWGYARDLYEIPAFKNNTYLRDIVKSNGNKSILFVDFNTRFWDQIDYEGLWSTPHDRQTKSADPEQKFFTGQAGGF